MTQRFQQTWINKQWITWKSSIMEEHKVPEKAFKASKKSLKAQGVHGDDAEKGFDSYSVSTKVLVLLLIRWCCHLKDPENRLNAELMMDALVKAGLPLQWSWWVSLAGLCEVAGQWPVPFTGGLLEVTVENGAVNMFKLVGEVPSLKKQAGVCALAPAPPVITLVTSCFYSMKQAGVCALLGD